VLIIVVTEKPQEYDIWGILLAKTTAAIKAFLSFFTRKWLFEIPPLPFLLLSNLSPTKSTLSKLDRKHACLFAFDL